MALIEELKGIVGSENVFDDPGTLEAYSRDESFARPMKKCRRSFNGPIKRPHRWYP